MGEGGGGYPVIAQHSMTRTPPRTPTPPKLCIVQIYISNFFYDPAQTQTCPLLHDPSSLPECSPPPPGLPLPPRNIP